MVNDNESLSKLESSNSDFYSETEATRTKHSSNKKHSYVRNRNWTELQTNTTSRAIKKRSKKEMEKRCKILDATKTVCEDPESLENQLPEGTETNSPAKLSKEIKQETIKTYVTDYTFKSSGRIVPTSE